LRQITLTAHDAFPAPGEAEVNQDELIRQQMKDIDDVICREIPLIGDKISLHSLMEEYDEDQVYRAKILVSSFISFNYFTMITNYRFHRIYKELINQ
jgi:hypothetical protein